MEFAAQKNGITAQRNGITAQRNGITARKSIDPWLKKFRGGLPSRHIPYLNPSHKSSSCRLKFECLWYDASTLQASIFLSYV
jgi:hypothetical protein